MSAVPTELQSDDAPGAISEDLMPAPTFETTSCEVYFQLVPKVMEFVHP